jgi:hypothetical protein
MFDMFFPRGKSLLVNRMNRESHVAITSSTAFLVRPRHVADRSGGRFKVCNCIVAEDDKTTQLKTLNKTSRSAVA